MKKLIFILIFILILFPLYSQEKNQQKSRLAVLDFLTNDISTGEMKSIINSLSNLFSKTGDYMVLDISQRDKQLSEMGFSAKDCSDPFLSIKDRQNSGC